MKLKLKAGDSLRFQYGFIVKRIIWQNWYHYRIWEKVLGVLLNGNDLKWTRNWMVTCKLLVDYIKIQESIFKKMRYVITINIINKEWNTWINCCNLPKRFITEYNLTYEWYMSVTHKKFYFVYILYSVVYFTSISTEHVYINNHELHYVGQMSAQFVKAVLKWSEVGLVKEARSAF